MPTTAAEVQPPKQKGENVESILGKNGFTPELEMFGGEQLYQSEHRLPE